MTKPPIPPPPPYYIPPPPGSPLAGSSADKSPSSADAALGEIVSSDRDATGKLTKGNRGRPKGSRNRRTIIVEQLFAGEIEAVAKVAISLARQGDMSAIKEILARVAPPRRGAPITVSGFPKIAGVADVPPALARLAEHVAAGELSPEEAQALATVLREFVNASETVDMERRLADLESRYAEK
jgi:hypothetical protein